MCRLNTFIFVACVIYVPQFVVSFAQASPNSITFQSRIVKPDGLPLEAASVNFRISLTDTVGSCIIFQEDFSNRDMTGNKGLINLAVGTGSKVFPVGPLTLAQAFNNYNSPTLNCQAGGSIVAGATDRRKLILQFNDGSGWQTVPAMDINSNPYALQADSAFKLGDFPAGDYVRTATFPTCVGGEALHFNGASFTCVAVGGGAGTVTGVSSANADIGVSVASPNPVLTLNSGTGANQIVKLDGTSQLPAVSGVNLTALNASNLGSGTVPAARMPALTGDVTMTAGTTATTIANNAVTNTHVAAGAAIARSKLAAGTVNHVLVNDGTGGAMSSIGCNNGELLKWAAGVPTCSADIGGVGDIVNGGNTTGATVVIGTNDAQSLQLETGGTTKMTILDNGNVGVGTITPTSRLQITGQSSGGSANAPIALSVTGGSGAAGYIGGGINIIGGLAGDNAGEGGAITIQGGTDGGATGGSIGLTGAGGRGGTPANTPGIVTIAGGDAGNGNSGGNVRLDGGAKSGGGSDGNVLLATARGNVGVGTTTPTLKLDVAGRINVIGPTSDSVMISGGNDTATGPQTIVIGKGAGAALTSGRDNTFIGYIAGAANTTASGNTFVGRAVAYQTTTGDLNTFVGNNVALANTTGARNVGVGHAAGMNSVSANRWVALGRYSLYEFTASGDTYNVAVGESALTGVSGQSIGTLNTALGGRSGAGVTSGTSNTFLGYNSGSAVTSGSNNVIIGSNTGASIATSSNNVLISDGAGNIRITTDSSGNVGIGTSTPQAKLDINGFMRMSKNLGAPAACTATIDASIAITSLYTTCICNGGATTWVSTADGTTPCVWQ